VVEEGGGCIRVVSSRFEPATPIAYASRPPSLSSIVKAHFLR
jgi:hypothetical protein